MLTYLFTKYIVCMNLNLLSPHHNFYHYSKLFITLTKTKLVCGLDQPESTDEESFPANKMSWHTAFGTTTKACDTPHISLGI